MLTKNLALVKPLQIVKSVTSYFHILETSNVLFHKLILDMRWLFSSAYIDFSNIFFWYCSLTHLTISWFIGWSFYVVIGGNKHLRVFFYFLVDFFRIGPVIVKIRSNFETLHIRLSIYHKFKRTHLWFFIKAIIHLHRLYTLKRC